MLTFFVIQSSEEKPKEEEEDEEEVFFGPVGFTEQCIAAGVEEESVRPLSPLKPDEWAHIASEAMSLAHKIKDLKTSDTDEEPGNADSIGNYFTSISIKT